MKARYRVDSGGFPADCRFVSAGRSGNSRPRGRRQLATGGWILVDQLACLGDPRRRTRTRVTFDRPGERRLSPVLSKLCGAGRSSGQDPGRVYPNSSDPDLQEWAQAYYGSSYDRLLGIKAKYDPDGVFGFDQSLRTMPGAGNYRSRFKGCHRDRVGRGVGRGRPRRAGLGGAGTRRPLDRPPRPRPGVGRPGRPRGGAVRGDPPPPPPASGAQRARRIESPTGQARQTHDVRHPALHGVDSPVGVGPSLV
jgi:Berberine and berberine like